MPWGVVAAGAVGAGASVIAARRSADAADAVIATFRRPLDLPDPLHEWPWWPWLVLEVWVQLWVMQ